jgi:secreted PhoX family phosphatase
VGSATLDPSAPGAPNDHVPSCTAVPFGCELAGACFSPDGTTMFVNVFGGGDAGSGMTCAITGPWARGGL